MNIIDIAIAKQLAGGGGGSGTDSYNDLSNLPKINDVTLSGNKSSSALGLQSEITSDSKLASDLVDDTNQDNKFVTSAEKTTWNGKQNAIDADHKINADYVDDSTSTNKFVTASDKETWNAKQNAIDNSHKLSSDLVDDANHTNKFVTSTEKNTWNGKQNAIDSEHKLSSSLVSFTTAEAAALASGIDSTKVAQISTNQSNILLVQNLSGVKNCIKILPISDWTGIPTSLTISINSEGAYVFNGTVSSGYKYIQIGSLAFQANTTYYMYHSALESGGYVYTADNNLASSVGNSYTYTANGTTGVIIRIGMSSASVTYNNEVIKPMIITKAVYDAGFTDYQPYAAPNYDLTYLQAEDRAALAEVVDSGAKQKFNTSLAEIKSANEGESTPPTWNNNVATLNGVTFTVNSDMSIRVQSSGNNTLAVLYLKKKNSGNYVHIEKNDWISGCPSGGGNASYGLRVYNPYGTAITDDYGDGVAVDTSGDYILAVLVRASQTMDKVFYPMVCTKAAFGVSNKFVPFGNDPFYQVPINHNMIYRGQNLGATLTDAQHTALSSGNFTDLYLGDYWTKTVTIPAGTYTGGDSKEVTVPAQTNITLKAVIADFDTFYAGYASTYAGINTHHAAVIVTGFSNVVWNGTNNTAGGYVNSLIHKWLVGSALPQIETWFGSAKVLSHQKLLTNAITGDAASGWAWSSQKISLLSENQMYGSKVWGNSKATNGGYEPGEAFKHLNIFNHIDANMLFGNKNIWLRDIASAVRSARLSDGGDAYSNDASNAGIAPAALILLS